MARVKVPHTEAVVIAEGPGSVWIENPAEAKAIFLEVGTLSAGSEGGTPKPIATEAAGYQWKAKAGPMAVSLAQGTVLTGIAETEEVEVHVLRDGPR